MVAWPTLVWTQVPQDRTGARRLAFLRDFAAAYAPLMWARDSLALVEADLHMRGDRHYAASAAPDRAESHPFPRRCTGGAPERAAAVLDTLATWWQSAATTARGDHIETVRQCVVGALDTLARSEVPAMRTAIRELATQMAAADDPSQYLARAGFTPHVAAAEREAIIRGDPHRYDRTLAQAVYDRAAVDQRVLAQVALREGQLQTARAAAEAAWGAEPSVEAAQLLRASDEAASDTAAIIQDLLRIVVAAPARSEDAARAGQRLATLRPALTGAALDTALDRVYDTEFRPLRLAAAQTPERGPHGGAAGGSHNSVHRAHTTLLEVSTAPDCGSCAAVDRALDGVLARYNAHEVIVLAEHFWGPFAAAGDTQVFHSRMYTTGVFEARNEYYNRVTHRQRWPDDLCEGFDVMIDGRCMGHPPYLGDQLYASAQASYDFMVDRLDLWKPSTAAYEPSAQLHLTVTPTAGRVRTTVVVDSIKPPQGQPGPTRLAVRVFLVEDSLRYVGQNHVRVHRCVVRAFSGSAVHDFGFPIPSRGGTVSDVTFDLVHVRQQLRVTNEGYRTWENDQIGARDDTANARQWLLPPYPDAVYTLNPAHLGVVAIVQDDATGRVLQSVYQPVNRAQTQSTDAM